MTDDDLDLLASVYLDGEATPEEVAMVERDPDLMARVAEIRAISEQVSITPAPPHAAMKEQHLAAALAEFTAAAAAQQVSPEQQREAAADPLPRSDSTVPSLAEKRRKREARKTERATTPGSLPQWLTAAAAFILIGGGVIFLAGRDGGDDATESAAIAADADDATDDSAEVSEMMEESDLAAESMQAADSDAMDDSAMDDGDMAEEATDEAAGEGTFDEVTPSSEEDAASSGAAPSTTVTQRTGGLLPEDPVMSYSSVPDADSALAELPDPRPDLLSSLCGIELDDRIDLEIIGYLPIEIAGAPAELFAVLTQDGSDSAIIVDENCEELTPGN